MALRETPQLEGSVEVAVEQLLVQTLRERPEELADSAEVEAEEAELVQIVDLEAQVDAVESERFIFLPHRKYIK